VRIVEQWSNPQNRTAAGIHFDVPLSISRQQSGALRAIVIIPEEQRVEEVESDLSLNALKQAVGGSIEFAHEFENGDTLYVSEESLNMMQDALMGRAPSSSAYMFDIEAHQPFAGRGIIVGPETPDGRPTECKSTLAEIREIVSYLIPGAATADEGSPH